MEFLAALEVDKGWRSLVDKARNESVLAAIQTNSIHARPPTQVRTRASTLPRYISSADDMLPPLTKLLQVCGPCGLKTWGGLCFATPSYSPVPYRAGGVLGRSASAIRYSLLM
jgi:hypothetical protein